MKHISCFLSGMLLVQSFIFSDQQKHEQFESQNESRFVTQEEKDFLEGFARGFEQGIKERFEERKQIEDLEKRKQILQDFLQNISPLVDQEYQKRVWVDGPEVENDDQRQDGVRPEKDHDIRKDIHF